MRVLIVEDNAGVRRLLASVLAPLALDVFECEDGLHALRAYEQLAPDVVLMDIAVRELDGIAATVEITRAHPEARIVIVTDYDEADLRDAAHAAGACEFMLKDNLLELPRLHRRGAGRAGRNTCAPHSPRGQAC